MSLKKNFGFSMKLFKCLKLIFFIKKQYCQEYLKKIDRVLINNAFKNFPSNEHLKQFLITIHSNFKIMPLRYYLRQ